MEKVKGTIIKGIGGFYYVKAADKTIECKARGIFRKENITPLVGDSVLVKLNTDENGVIEEIYPRKNSLIRPPVSNISQVAVVFATENPRPNMLIIDKFIAACEESSLDILICINKTDLQSGNEYAEIYQNAGFDVLSLSATTGLNIELLKEKLKNKITVFAGNSGVGKSSLLNSVLGEEIFQTGEVSEKVERGKHTTRHSELLPLPFGGYIIDTPGFSSFDIAKIDFPELHLYFREFGNIDKSCKFPDCSHTVEKGCAVLEAVKNGEISPTRHENYVHLYNELKNIKKW
ncbi:MAG: ribosome small subunit-dependent GTPase A [Ruminococcaceae bacterium]|nr:ribosome small subunit-dependent GTPase A [Oscillospiraceae bacterium]